ncbi:DVU0524 family FlgM-associated protein [Dissulfuribacter thermophilus]|nr:DVU0524 family FlgM-associated protein [Dissulfuribacter thermophilus]
MNVSPYQIQNVIRAYGQRIGKKGLIRLESDNSRYSPDVVNISSEAKQKLITQKVATDIIAKVKGKEVTDSRLGAYLAEKVSEELGGNLEIAGSLEGKKGLRFRVIDPQKGEILKELSSKDAEDLIMRIYSKIEKIGSE